MSYSQEELRAMGALPPDEESSEERDAIEADLYRRLAELECRIAEGDV